MRLKNKKIETDVLCIGGGIAGLMAAIRASECGSRVLVVEKANTLLVPFLFVYYPEILLMGSVGIILYSIFTSFIAISSIAIAFQGFLFQNLHWISRTGFLIAGLLLVYPYWLTDLVGYLLLAILVSLHVIVVRVHRKLFITKSE